LSDLFCIATLGIKVTEMKLPPLARSALDRDYLSRSKPELFDELWSIETTRILAMHNGKVLLEETSSGAVLKLLTTEQVPTANLRVYLGKTTESESKEPAGSAIVLAVLNDNSANQIEPDETKWFGLRQTGAGLSARDAGIFTQGLALNNWHLNHQHCPGCGTPTVIEQGGWVRRCFKDDRELYPRIDPAIIVAITDQEDRILLGSQGVWEQNRWSILAGFVEPGESLEAAVQREMFEECGLSVNNVKYVYSQSWPYPFSLMLGFEAKADSSELLLPDGEEIVKLRWFSKKELAALAGELLLPGQSTISRSLIERWYGSAIKSATEEKSNGQK
jgi:NAD+ diphosphatase